MAGKGDVAPKYAQTPPPPHGAGLLAVQIALEG